MWTDSKSIALSKFCVVSIMAMLVMCAAIAPWALNGLFLHLTETGKALFLATIYTGSVPAAALLALLFLFLRRIGQGRVFVNENRNCLRHISWCCFAGAAICFLSSLYWLPWFAIGVAAGFMGLIVRVVKNVIAKAISLQDDADHTI